MAKITLHQGASIEETFKDFIISRKTKGLADKTIESYNYHFHAIAHHLDIYKDITDLTKSDLDNMIASMRGANISANSISTYTRCLRAFFSWCNEECITQLNMKLYKGVETVKDTYTDRELEKLLKKPDIRKCGFAEYRDWVIVNFLLNSGSRAATIRAIQIRDIDFDNGLVHYNIDDVNVNFFSQVCYLLSSFGKMHWHCDRSILVELNTNIFTFKSHSIEL